MAEESENVGGINIEASVSDAKVDAGLAALLAKIESAAKQISGALVINPTFAQGAGVQRQVQQSTQLTFGGKAKGAASAAESSALERAIADALAREGKTTADATTGALKKGRESTNLTIEQALAQSVGGQAPTAVPVSLDTDQFMQQFAAFLTELKGMVGQASQIAQVDVGDGGGGGGKGGLRRKNIRDRGIGTEAAANRVYTYDPAVYQEEESRREAQAAQARERILSQRKAPAMSDAERRFLATLQGAQQQTSRFSPEMERELRELSYENEQAGGAGRTSSTFVGGPRRSESEIRAFREAEARRADQAPLSAQDRASLEARLARAATVSGRASQSIDLASATGRGGRGGGGTRTGVGQDPEDRERRAQEQIAISESQRLTAARTSRTFASGLGGFFLGQTRQQTEATIRLRKNEQELTTARRRLYDPEIIGSARAYKHAQEEVATAEGKVADSLAEVQSFTGGVSAVRTLASVTIAGAAFGLGLKAIDAGIAAAGKSLDPYLQQLTGYINISQQLTGELSDQARANSGNVAGVVAQRIAMAGLSNATAKSIAPIIEQRTSIEAGNKAITDQIALIRAAQQIQSQGPGAGLGTTTGGILGTPLFGVPSTGEQIGGLLTDLQKQVATAAQGGRGGAQLNGPRAPGALPFGPQETERAAGAFRQGLQFVNDQLEKGGDGAARFSQDLSKTNPQIERTASAFDNLSPQMAAAVRQAGLYSNEINTINDAMKALSAINFAGTLPDPEQVGRQALAAEQVRQRASAASLDAIRAQQKFELPSILAGAERQQQFTLRTQLPAEQALQNLAQPLQPIGTGISANADEQARLNGLQAKSQDLQDELNAGYAQGRQILATTYQVPLQLLTQIAGVGQQIAGLQAGISNEAAAYQTAQYNFQLQIARRTLSDIGGLTGKNFGAGESYLGVLERQNLALSRQAQLLQFALAQRQINFQQAVAGFQAPGVTPEERQANVKEAQIEADYAQKQLDIQKQMFGNQVQIVDIQNLRQGADLAAQIGLLLQGRQLTLDTAAAQEQINLLQTKESQLVAQAGTYLTKVNNLTSVAFGQIQQLEAAAGRAMYTTAYSVLDAFGIVLNGLTTQLQSYNGISDSRSEGNSSIVNHASGYVGTTSGKTMTGVGYMGEANMETYAILRNPKPLMGGLGGGGDVNITFGDVYVRDDGDVQKIVGAVVRALGTRASLVGLRLNG